ncbi:DUF6191 domain-containing protein [Actinokineospora inagensis]|uniref:DUF6191 domain-containing protein n=1 Tax=Actinokineospora inagensis TaxID=103730 RepID=UPI000416677F|nr:DUF6191 domain-containing protein [Actinokineospora inagensis]
MDTLETVLTLSVPASSIGLVVAGVYELRRQRRKGGTGAPVTATYVNEFTAIFYGSKRTQLDHRDSTSLLRDDQHQGDKPWPDDLTQGIVLERRPRPPGDAQA